MAHRSCFTRCCTVQLSTLLCLLFLTTFSAAKALESKSLSPTTKSPPPSTKSPPPPTKSPPPPTKSPPPPAKPPPPTTKSPPPPTKSPQPPTKSPPPPRSPPSRASRPPPNSRSPPSPRKLTSKPPPPRAPRPVPKPPRVPPSPNLWRPRDGIRLVGFNSSRRGWLEMLVEQGVNYNDTTRTWIYDWVWTPICGPLPRDNMPQLLCQLMGFRYGQLYQGVGNLNYDDDFRRGNGGSMAQPQGLEDCDVKNPPWGKLVANIGEYNCWLDRNWETWRSDCIWLPGFRGVVALQCSGTNMPPAKPSPPPPPPPPRRDVADYINLLETEYNLNIDYPFARFDIRYRVELLVGTSSDGRTGSNVWAPLCALEDSNLDIVVLTQKVCDQFYAGSTGRYAYTAPWVRDPIRIPTGAVPEDDGFNPAKYKHWVTVVGGVQNGLDAVQEMDLTVTTTPCSSGYIFDLACELIMM